MNNCLLWCSYVAWFSEISLTFLLSIIISMKCMIHVPGRVDMEECSLDIFKLETDHMFFFLFVFFWLGTGADFLSISLN